MRFTIPNEVIYEYPDPQPMEITLLDKKARKAEEERQRIVGIIRGELSRLSVAQGGESLEEANDFDMDDNFDPVSQYEAALMELERPLSGLDNPPLQNDVKAEGQPAADPPASPTPPAATPAAPSPQ